MCTFSYVRNFGMKYFKIHNGYILNHPPIDLILIIQFKGVHQYNRVIIGEDFSLH
jgi:hypothetical protein